MVEKDRTEFCAFHFTNETDGKCSLCGLTLCNLDQQYNTAAERICQLCYNISRARKLIKYFQFGLWGIAIAIFIIIWQVMGALNFFAMIPLLLVLVFPYLTRPLIMKLYFREIEPIESVLPIVRYFEASGNQDHYKIFMKIIDKLSEEEMREIKPKLFDYLVPALAFNYAKLPEDWDTNLVEKLKMSKDEFMGILLSDYRKTLIQTAVHNPQDNFSKFLIYLSESAQDTDLLKEYINEITSKDVISSTDEELNSIYNKLLEELYLYEEKFNEICDELKLTKQKDLIAQLLKRYEPPPVPKNQIEAVLTIEQLKEKRRKESEEPPIVVYTSNEEQQTETEEE
ncbi:MAG: hypothetical protein H7641_13585 [Candidatus Heimdallarchaeota archaeon]|nr:hypothetical protein [Candidatus Heimdallarchaeota archaeon]MCK4878593.1 hypothetical protein [Candidatus Heimdallarchaeota archaeon]